MIPLWLPLLLTGLGVGANAIGAKKADRAQADVMAANRIRQSTADKKAFAVSNEAKDRYKGIEDQQDERTADLTEMLTDVGEGEAPAYSMPASDSNITVSRTGQEKAKAKDFTDQQAEAKARLMSLGDLFGDADVGFARDASKIAQIGGEKQGWMNVMPAELDAAANAGSGWRMAGDIFGGLGSVATMGALSGASLPAGLAGLFGGGGAAAPAAGTNLLAQNARPAAGGIARLFGRG